MQPDDHNTLSCICPTPKRCCLVGHRTLESVHEVKDLAKDICSRHGVSMPVGLEESRFRNAPEPPGNLGHGHLVPAECGEESWRFATNDPPPHTIGSIQAMLGTFQKDLSGLIGSQIPRQGEITQRYGFHL